MRVLVLGGSGLVGTRFVQTAAADLNLIAPTHGQLDVLDADALAAYLQHTQPDAVLNLAAWADVDAAEAERDDNGGRVFALNARFPQHLAHICRQHRVHLVHVSTDYVFDGTRADRPYAETDPPNPLSWYARTKYLGEQNVLQTYPTACVARIEMPFTAGAAPKSDFARLVARRLRANEPLAAVDDQRITPILLEDAAEALKRLLSEPFTGIVHLAATTWTTPYEYALGVARRLGLPEEQISRQHFADFASTRPAARPQHSWLDVSLFRRHCSGCILRSMDAQLDAWAAAWRNPGDGTQSANTLERRWTHTSSR